MTSRNLLNAILALCLAGLIALAIYEPGKETKATPELLTTLNAADIHHIVIESDRQPKIVLDKTKDQWQMVEPYSIAANSGKIDNLLAIVGTTTYAHYRFSEVDARQLKLDAPDLILHLDNTTLAFGTTSSLGGNRYILTSDTVYLITDRFSHLVRGPATALISPELLPMHPDIKKLTLPALAIETDDKGWHVVAGPSDSSSDHIQQIIDEWRYARALQVTRMEADSSPRKVIEVLTASNINPVRFSLLEREDEVLLQRDDLGLSYHFTSEAGKRLLTLPTDKPAAPKQSNIPTTP